MEMLCSRWVWVSHSPTLGQYPHSVNLLGPAVGSWQTSSNLSCHPPAKSSREGIFWVPFLPFPWISP